jgi:hypothetical protein
LFDGSFPDPVIAADNIEYADMDPFDIGIDEGLFLEDVARRSTAQFPRAVDDDLVTRFLRCFQKRSYLAKIRTWFWKLASFNRFGEEYSAE